MYFNRILKQATADSHTQLPTIESVAIKLTHTISETQRKGESVTKYEYFELVMCVTALKLVAAMKANEVTLLPDLYESFQSDVATRAASFPSLMPIGDVPGPRWLASQLSWYFGEMLIVECNHKRFGSLLYHVNCDLLNAVSLALGRGRLHNKAVYRESVATQPSKASHWNQQIACVADYLNNRVHQ